MSSWPNISVFVISTISSLGAMVGLTVASTVSLHNQYNLSQPVLLMGDISPTARSGLYPDDLRSAARQSTAPDFNQASSLDPWLSTSSQVSSRDLNEQQPRQSQQWRSRRHGSSALPLDDSTAIYGRIWWTHSTGSSPFRPFTFSSNWVPQRHQCNSTDVTDALHNEIDTFTLSETTTFQAGSDTTGMYTAPQAAAPRVLCSTPSPTSVITIVNRAIQQLQQLVSHCHFHCNFESKSLAFLQLLQQLLQRALAVQYLALATQLLTQRIRRTPAAYIAATKQLVTKESQQHDTISTVHYTASNTAVTAKATYGHTAAASVIVHASRTAFRLTAYKQSTVQRLSQSTQLISASDQARMSTPTVQQNMQRTSIVLQQHMQQRQHFNCAATQQLATEDFQRLSLRRSSSSSCSWLHSSH